MLKSDLAKILIERNNLSPRDAESVVESVFEALLQALRSGENIEIRGLGTFHLRNYAAYTGRNPSTREKIAVAPKRGVLFRTSKQLRDRMNRKK